MSMQRKWLAVSIAAALGAAGATVIHLQQSGSGSGAPSAPVQAGGPAGSLPAAPGGSTMDRLTRPHIVVLSEAPLASYRGGIAGLAAPARMKTGRGAGRVDVRGAAAKRYVQFLEQVQTTRTADLGRAIGRPLQVRQRMQHALNAIVADLTPDEAQRLEAEAGVALVEPYREDPLNTDVGPALIGAVPVWTGGVPGESGRFQGEGVVVGIIDTGINFGSPSFAAVDPVDGYRHVNELGAGNYLGTCAPGGADAGRCNDKLIGGYDFVCAIPTSATQTICSQPALYREEPGFGDTNSHGSHTASTAAGNRRDVVFRGTPLRISGVAPRANIVAYDTCYTNISTGQGLCPNVATVAAVNQAVADGVVDVLNFSIGGGTNPWGDALSQAFLNAVDSGIYVAASAGNSGPGESTLGHHQPWVSTTAASQHGRGDFVFTMDITGPAPVPEALRGLELSEGGGSPPLAATLPPGTPLRVSPGIDAADDGCAAYPAGTFSGSIALVRRGTCAFTIKAANAAAAGAVTVVVANNAAGPITPSVPGVTLPVFGVTQAAGDAIRDFAGGPGGTVAATIPKGAIPLSNTPDQLAGFSSRGPGGSVLKPDLTAPGVSILAVIAGTTLAPGSENVIGLLSGTSMASPHNAGAAALMKQARPGWTPGEIKSALMMTALRDVLLEDGTTPAHPFARGAGRIRVDQAIRAGLVLDETKARYLAANPATGGDPASLNLASMTNAGCFERCSFTRTFRNTLSHRQGWSVRLEGVRGAVRPAAFRIEPGESVSVTFTVLTNHLAADGRYNFGEARLVPNGVGNPNQPELRMPVAVAVQPAKAVLPAQVEVSVPAGGQARVDVTLGNTGGSRLRYAADNSGTAALEIANTVPTASGSGFRSSRYTDTTNPPGQYAADDFLLHGNTQLTSLVAHGFLLTTTPLASATQAITWSVYPDAGGAPAGNPETAPGTAVWSYTAPPTAAGVGTANSTISLDLAAAAQNVTLPAGRYWLVVSARTTFANRWVWYAADAGARDSLPGFATITPAAGGWAANAGFPGLAWRVGAQVTCGAPWIGAITPAAGDLQPGESQTLRVRIDARGLAAGRYDAYACLSTNDPGQPRIATPVALTVTP